MQTSKHYIFIIFLWVFAIQFNEVISHFDADVIEVQQDKEGEKEIENKTLKIRDWNSSFGLNPNENNTNRFACNLNLHHSLFHQWSPDIVIPPPEA